MNAARALRIAWLAGLAVAVALAAHGAVTVAGGGSGWDSQTERVAYGLLQMLAGGSIAAGLLLSHRSRRTGMTLVAAGVIGISIMWYWFVIVTIPAGLALLAVAYSRGRATAYLAVARPPAAGPRSRRST